MKIIDLFAGAGGLTEGFRRNKLDVVAHVEMDMNAALTLKTREAYYYCKKTGNLSLYKQYIQKEITRDEFYSKIPEKTLKSVINLEISDDSFPTIISKIDNLLLGERNVGIIGGPPCQAYSIAGRSRDKNKMKDDPRNFLYKYYLRFIEYYKPVFFVFENVLGLLSAYDGDIYKDIQKEMKELGYDIYCNILDASDFGVVQKRKRIIINGWKKELNISNPKFPVVKKKYTIKDLFADLPTINSGEYSHKYSKKANDCTQNLHIRDESWNVLTYHESRSLNKRDAQIYKACCNAWNTEKKTLKYNELPKQLITHKNTEGFLDRYKVVDNNSLSHTIVAHISKDGHHYIHPDPKQCRSITVREAARIQSFPDDYFFESSKTSALKQIGNAVPPLMAEKICNILLKQFYEALKSNL